MGNQTRLMIKMLELSKIDSRDRSRTPVNSGKVTKELRVIDVSSAVVGHTGRNIMSIPSKLTAVVSYNCQIRYISV